MRLRNACLTAAGVLGAATAASARKDYLEGEELTARTQAVMWPTYALLTVSLLQEAAGPSTRLPAPRRSAHLVGGALVAAGAALFIGGASRFRSLAGLAGRETEGLLTDGIYTRTRNPQYLGNLMVATGTSIWARSLPSTLLSVGAFALYQLYLPAEEAHLERAFGDEYRRYKSATPRWL